MNVYLFKYLIIKYRKLNYNAVECIIKIMLWVMSEFLLISTHFMSPPMSESKLHRPLTETMRCLTVLSSWPVILSAHSFIVVLWSSAMHCVSYLCRGRSQCIVQSWESQWVGVRKSCSRKCVGVLPGRIEGKVWRNKP